MSTNGVIVEWNRNRFDDRFRGKNSGCLVSYLWKLRLDEKLVKKVNSRINSSNRGGLMKFVPFASVCICVYVQYVYWSYTNIRMM